MPCLPIRTRKLSLARFRSSSYSKGRNFLHHGRKAVAIPPADKQAILNALTLFDSDYRATQAWANWESNRAHKFAVRNAGKLYPAKKIVSLATDLPVHDFTGGAPTNGFLKARGFEVVDLRVSPKLEFVKGKIYDRQTEIHRPFGGSFQSGIAPSNKAPTVFLFSGSSGEQYGYTDMEDDRGVYSYTGEGQVGPMQLTRGNLAIQRHAEQGRSLHLFRTMGKKKGQKYLGEYACSDLSWRRGPDRNGDDRDVIVFHLVPVNDLLVYEATPQDEQPVSASQSSLEELRRHAYQATVASEHGNRSTASRTIYSRSNAVRLYVLKRAAGKCESCESDAPFTTKTGQPYLEPHHINRLSDGGLDHPRYIGAICPTCHKEIHYGANGAARNETLRVAILAKEPR